MKSERVETDIEVSVLDFTELKGKAQKQWEKEHAGKKAHSVTNESFPISLLV